MARASLEVGKTFSTLQDLQSFVKCVEEELCIVVSIADSETITKASSKTKWVRETANPELYYKYVVYNCYKSGNQRSHSTGQRKRPSMKQNCPWKLLVSLQDKGENKGQELVIKEVRTEHNHDIVKAIVDCHVKRRKLDEHSKEMACQALQLRSNKKMLQQRLKRETGKMVILKDLVNIEQKLETKSPENIQGLINHLQDNNRNLKVHVAYDDQAGSVEGIFVMDPEMEALYKAYPEVLLMDATYKLTNDRMAVYILLAIDGNGECHVVSFFLAHNETHNLLGQMVSAFKSNFDPSVTSQTKVIITDKDFTERSVLTTAFPNAQLQLCLFHTLRSFSREVSALKMSFRTEQRNTVLALFQRLAYSKNQTEYDQHLQYLEEANFPMVTDYIKRNWHDIRKEWVVGLKAESLMLSQHTTNRLESLNKHIKSVVSKFSNLPAFFEQFFLFLDSCRDERHHRAARMLDATIVTDDETERKFRCHLTKFAWEQMEKQYAHARKVDVAALPDGGFCVDGHSGVKVDACNCSFATSNGLPCVHILAARSHSQLEVFDPCLFLPRWTRKHFIENKPQFQQPETINKDDNVEITFQSSCVQRQDSGNYNHRLSKAKVYCAKLASALAMLPQEMFDQQIEQIKLMDRLVNEQKMCVVVEIKQQDTT